MLKAVSAILNQPAADESIRGVDSRIHLLVTGLLIGAAYYTGALIGFALTFPDDAVSALWPPNAILLAALLLTPMRSWWAIFLGVLPAHFAVQLQTNVPLLMICCWLISNLAEAILGAFLVRLCIHGELKFDRFRHVGIFTAFAVLLSPFATSFLDAGFVVLNQWRQVHFWDVWTTRFPGNAVAAITLAPAIVLWSGASRKNFMSASTTRWLETCALTSGLITISLVVFSWQSAGPNTLPALVYAPLPFLLWAAVRFGPLGSSTCVLVLCLISIWGTVHGRGPFTSSSAEENVFFLQLFLFFVSMPLLFLAALLEERRCTEQTRAQAAAIVESSQDAIIGCTLSGVITTWNRGATKLYGYSLGEAVGQPVKMLLPLDARDYVKQVIEKIKQGKGIQTFEGRRIAKGGRVVDVSISVSPVTDASGTLTGLSSIARDITEWKKNRDELRKSEAKFSGILAIAADAIISVDESQRIILFNEGAEKIFGYAKAEVLGQALDILIPLRFREQHQSHIRDFGAAAAVSRQMGERREIRGLRKGGEEFPAEASISQLQLDGERIFTVLLRDISEHKRAEEALRNSERRFRELISDVPTAVYVCDSSGLIEWYNQRAIELWGREPKCGNPADRFCGSYRIYTPNGNYLAHAECPMARALAAETPASDAEIIIERPDGSRRTAIVNIILRRDERGNVTGAINCLADITDRRQAEEALNEALSEIGRLKERLEAENVYLRAEVSQAYRYGEMIGESEGIKKVFEQIGRVAPTEMTVLILGETGTGKELVARAVHERSSRRERPLVKVNCSALPADLIESELFGHERGAFTGAVSKQVGRFELADGGTIFLDEIGELPLRLQAKLLRVLQEGEFERLGSSKTIKVDVRVIAATNRNLSEAAHKGRFRIDLYYRLNVYPIEVAPLRERKADIESMARVFLQESGRHLGRSFGPISREVVEELECYDWPGNVRELENVIGRAALISNGSSLQLPEGWNKDHLAAGHKSSISKNGANANSQATDSDREATLAELEKAHVLEVLHQTNWRVEGPHGAALILGLHPNTLRSRMRKLGIQKPALEKRSEAKPNNGKNLTH